MDGYYPDYDSEEDDQQVGGKNEKGVAQHFLTLTTNVIDPDLSVYHKGTKIIAGFSPIETLSIMSFGSPNPTYRVHIRSRDKLAIQVECTECGVKILTTRNKSWTALQCIKCKSVLFFHPKQWPSKKEWSKLFFNVKKNRKPPRKKVKFENDFEKVKVYAEDCFEMYTYFKDTTYTYDSYFKEFLAKLAFFMKRFGWDGQFRDIFISSTTHISVMRYLMYIYLKYDYNKSQIETQEQNILIYHDYVRHDFYQSSEIAILKAGNEVEPAFYMYPFK
jgi:hypothetical protein